MYVCMCVCVHVCMWRVLMSAVFPPLRVYDTAGDNGGREGRRSTYGTVNAKERALSYEYITPNRALSLILHSLEHLHLVVRVCVCQHVRVCHTTTHARTHARTRTTGIAWEIFVFVRVIYLFCQRYLDGGQDKERERYKCGERRRTGSPRK